MISFGQNGTSDGAEKTACRCHELPSGQDRSDAAGEMNELARELAATFGEKLNTYCQHAKVTAEEAAKRIAHDAAKHIDRILNEPPEAVNWLDLYALGETDPSLALECWEKIKEAAHNEIRIGYRAARVVEDAGDPLERARFLAVRAELTAAWQPRNAVEKQLVDQLAQWQVLLWRWQEAMTAWSNVAAADLRQAKKGESYETMRLTEAEALERAMKKVEQLHGLYLRTLKALQDQRRLRPSGVVRQAEQVNVGPVQIGVDKLGLFYHGSEGPP